MEEVCPSRTLRALCLSRVPGYLLARSVFPLLFSEFWIDSTDESTFVVDVIWKRTLVNYCQTNGHFKHVKIDRLNYYVIKGNNKQGCYNTGVSRIRGGHQTLFKGNCNLGYAGFLVVEGIQCQVLIIKLSTSVSFLFSLVLTE